MLCRWSAVSCIYATQVGNSLVVTVFCFAFWFWQAICVELEPLCFRMEVFFHLKQSRLVDEFIMVVFRDKDNCSPTEVNCTK